MLIFTGQGFINSLINKLPFEAHIPGYRFCGPGTKLEKRLTRGDQGINKLDEACKEHDIAYSKSDNIVDRHKADNILEHRAWNRVKSKDASLGEKSAAWFITNAMKTKQKFGMGAMSKIPFSTLVRDVNNVLNEQVLGKGYTDERKIASTAVKIAKKIIKNNGGRKKYHLPRTIKLGKKIGGFIGLVPAIVAGIASLVNGGINAYNAYKSIKKGSQDESKPQQRVGSGLFLKKNHLGFSLKLIKKKKKSQKK